MTDRHPSQRKPDKVEIGNQLEVVEGPYFGWEGTVVGFGEEEGWIVVDFNGNHIEIPACKAAKL